MTDDLSIKEYIRAETTFADDNADASTTKRLQPRSWIEKAQRPVDAYNADDLTTGRRARICPISVHTYSGSCRPMLMLRDELLPLLTSGLSIPRQSGTNADTMQPHAADARTTERRRARLSRQRRQYSCQAAKDQIGCLRLPTKLMASAFPRVSASIRSGKFPDSA